MMWTETFLRKEKINKLYHFSDEKVKKWKLIPTCFFDNKSRSYGYVYEFIFEEGTIADYYESDEYRIDLKNVSANRIRLVGKREYLGKGKVKENWF